MTLKGMTLKVKARVMATVTFQEAVPAQGWVPDRVHDIALPASFRSQIPDLTVRRSRSVKAREVIFLADATLKTQAPETLMVQKRMHSNNCAVLTAPLALACLATLPLTLAACGYQPSLGDCRPMVDSYNTNVAAYKADRGQCVAVAMQAQAAYER